MTTINEDKRYLLQDLGLHLATTCSVDEAVGMMLGILKGPDWYYDIDRSYEEANGYYQSVDDTFYLSDHLEYKRGRLQMAHWNAKESKAGEEELTILLNKIEQFDTDYMKKAKVYWCLIHDELSKSDSQLRTIDNGHGVKEITLASLDEWWAKKQNPQQEVKSIEQSIFKDMQNNVPKVRDGKNDEEFSFSENVTFGLLLRAFVELAKAEPNEYGTPDKVKILPVAEVLQGLAMKLCHVIPAQGETSIRKRLTTAEKALKEYIGT